MAPGVTIAWNVARELDELESTSTTFMRRIDDKDRRPLDAPLQRMRRPGLAPMELAGRGIDIPNHRGIRIME